MKNKINRVLERDIDLIVADSLVNDEIFADIFFSLVDISGAWVSGVSISRTDMVLGESDITIYATRGNMRYAILIEDQIDAEAMPQQYSRYEKRAEQMIKDNLVDETFVFLIAPKHYRDTNTEAGKYPNFISYEQMQSYFSDVNPFKAMLFENAVNKEKSGYTPIEDVKVISFWQEYYKYKRNNYNNLLLREIEGSRGVKASWVTFKTNNKYIEIWHKSDKGFVDLQMAGLGDRYEYVRDILSDMLDKDMSVAQTGKSATIRLKVPPIDFREDFDKYINDEIPKAFDAVERLFKLSEKINYDKLCKDVGQ